MRCVRCIARRLSRRPPSRRSRLLPLLGIHPALGRTFSPDEEIEGRDRVVMMSDAFWRGRFGADPSIIGRNIILNDQTYVVAGILPRHFLFPRLEQIFTMGIAGGRPELWMPFAVREPERGENSFAAIGKLKPGVSAEAAASELRAMVERVAAGIPNAARQIGVDVVPLHDQITGGARASLMLLWAAIATVLLIACGNITNLLLVRGGARGPELAVRSALGASRATLIRHSLVDSLILAAIGGAGGLLVALWVLPLILRFAPASLPRLDEVVVNARALVFAAVVTIGMGILVGLVPARRAAQTDVIESLKQSVRAGRGAIQGTRDPAGARRVEDLGAADGRRRRGATGGNRRGHRRAPGRCGGKHAPKQPVRRRPPKSLDPGRRRPAGPCGRACGGLAAGTPRGQARPGRHAARRVVSAFRRTKVRLRPNPTRSGFPVLGFPPGGRVP